MRLPQPFLAAIKAGATVGGGLIILSLAASSTIKVLQFATEAKRHTTVSQLFGERILLMLKNVSDASGIVCFPVSMCLQVSFILMDSNARNLYCCTASMVCTI
ncbi:uncharacterized protein LOC104902088 isoform X2 [Beta vulgaris subsp. vulgaris]|uniref:uncharacterized protein LOC104902088 isoform X2 n=1 Tax=Beta vulgaris subsp. vulgaris TaxID=3555 RepID=UPI00254962D1|nr:uncharacterized protein LOC104902088 isoform X2 [Beta vulgaris subsp. vulgaris]